MRKHLARLPFVSSHRPRLSWQARRKNSSDKVALIGPLLKEFGCRSVLDVGCNAGEVTRQLSRQCFAVGIDQSLTLAGFPEPLKGVCLGEVQITLDTIGNIPTFDAVLLLSVHHQWHYHRDEDFTTELVRAIADRAARVFVIEFAAINSKYQESGGSRFKDNDEESVMSYAENWLAEVLPAHSGRFLGKTPESPVEPYRFMYACEPLRASQSGPDSSRL